MRGEVIGSLPEIITCRLYTQNASSAEGMLTESGTGVTRETKRGAKNRCGANFVPGHISITTMLHTRRSSLECGTTQGLHPLHQTARSQQSAEAIAEICFHFEGTRPR
jgi:hypothetical protein